jgi:hypothetical protein
LRREREVIILHQDQRRVAGRLVTNGIGEPRVDGAVRVEVGRPKDWSHVCPVAQRPECFIRKSVVIALPLMCVEPDTPEPVLRTGGWHVQSVPPIDDSAIGGSGTVCHPYSGAGLDERF